MDNNHFHVLVHHSEDRPRLGRSHDFFSCCTQLLEPRHPVAMKPFTDHYAVLNVRPDATLNHLQASGLATINYFVEFRVVKELFVQQLQTTRTGATLNAGTQHVRI